MQPSFSENCNKRIVFPLVLRQLQPTHYLQQVNAEIYNQTKPANWQTKFFFCLLVDTICINNSPWAGVRVNGKKLLCDDPELKCNDFFFDLSDHCCKCNPKCCNKCASNDQSVCPQPTYSPTPSPTWYNPIKPSSYDNRPTVGRSGTSNNNSSGNEIIIFVCILVVLVTGLVFKHMSREKVPDDEAFRVAHKPEPVLKTSSSSSSQFIGSNVGAGPSTERPIRLKMKEKFFSWSQDTFKIKDLATDGPFGNGIQVKGQAMSMRDEMALLDGDGQALAVCRKKFEFGATTFKIYVPKQVTSGQSPSQQRYKGQPLYTYCEVKKEMFNGIKVYLESNKNVAAYSISRGQTMFGKTRIIKKKGIPAALIEGGHREGQRDTYEIKINPGIDPCLIICICAICDEMDES